MVGSPTRIDVHHHMAPGAYAQWLRENGVKPGGLEIPEWTSQKSLKFMNRMGIRTAILSVSAPGTWLGDRAQSLYWARWLNEAAARICHINPNRFGYFATLPLPDIDAAIAEAEHCLDHLQADGVVLLSNTDGVYLGDPFYAPLLEYLNERKAVVLVHPADLPAAPLPEVPAYVADALLDTTRTALSLINADALDTYPQIRFILANAGGFLPFIAYRVLLAHLGQESRSSQMLAFLQRKRELPERVKLLQRFYYDLAMSSTSAAMPSILAVADERKIVFGTDFPFAPSAAVRMLLDQYENYDLKLHEHQNIDYRNCYSLFPRLAAG